MLYRGLMTYHTADETDDRSNGRISLDDITIGSLVWAQRDPAQCDPSVGGVVIDIFERNDQVFVFDPYRDTYVILRKRCIDLDSCVVAPSVTRAVAQCAARAVFGIGPVDNHRVLSATLRLTDMRAGLYLGPAAD